VTAGPGSNEAARELIVDSIRRRKHAFQRLAAWSALEAVIPAGYSTAPEEVRTQRGQARVAHLLATDPGGNHCFGDPLGETASPEVPP